MFFITLCLLFLVATANVEIGKEIKVQEDPDHGLHVSKSNAYRYFNFVRQWSPNGCYQCATGNPVPVPVPANPAIFFPSGSGSGSG